MPNKSVHGSKNQEAEETALLQIDQGSLEQQQLLWDASKWEIAQPLLSATALRIISSHRQSRRTRRTSASNRATRASQSPRPWGGGGGAPNPGGLPSPERSRRRQQRREARRRAAEQRRLAKEKASKQDDQDASDGKFGKVACAKHVRLLVEQALDMFAVRSPTRSLSSRNRKWSRCYNACPCWSLIGRAASSSSRNDTDEETALFPQVQQHAPASEGHTASRATFLGG